MKVDEKNFKLAKTLFKHNMHRSERLSFIYENMEKRGILERFYEAPCSSKYHLCQKGGLLIHSDNVVNCAQKMSYSLFGDEDRPAFDSIILCSLLHDIGKIGDLDNPYYIEQEDGTFKTNKNMFPHEVLSAMWVQELSDGKLSMDEYMAILYHNGLYTPAGQVIMGKETPLMMLVHWADMWACRVMEKE